MSDASTEIATIDASTIDGPTPRRGRAALTALAAFAVYLAASLVIWGVLALTRLGTYYIPRQDSPDSYFFRWAMTWVPWAVAHGRDPLATDVIFAPYPVTLTWVTMVPGPALVMWPVTHVFGSLVSFNVLVLLAPALDGRATFLSSSLDQSVLGVAGRRTVLRLLVLHREADEPSQPAPRVPDPLLV